MKKIAARKEKVRASVMERSNMNS